MKLIVITAILLNITAALAQIETTQMVESEAINVDGVLRERESSDGELETIKAEIQKQKKEVVLNKHKAKGYQELSKSVEKLSETTEEYILEKKAAQEEIAAYNLKVKCMQAETPGPECDKHNRRRN